VRRVVLGALVHDDRVLLVHRRPDKHAYPDVWDLPGGLVEPGESDLDALVRELHEELGVHVETASVEYLCEVEIGGEGGGGDRVVLSGWLVRAWRGTPANVAPEEHDGLDWFDVDALPPPPHPSMRRALLAALRRGADQ
jgi:8-oxo-dGTP diphosphatase